jgi:Signal transduction histidine kinase
MKKWFVLWCLFTSILSPITANKILITNINEKYNLPKNNAHCMFQDSKGFLWFGMENGLYKFDLNSFTNVSSIKTRIYGFPKSDVRAILEYAPGILLIGTYNKGLWGYNTITETAFPIVLNSPVNFSKSFIHCFHLDKSGSIWIGTSNSLLRIKPLANKPNSFELLNQFNKLNSGIVNDVYSIIESKTGVIWFLTMSRLGYYNPATKKTAIFSTDGSNSLITFLNDKQILIGCFGNGAKTFNTETFKIEPFKINGLSDKAQTLYVLKDSHSNIWLSIANEGMLLWEPNTPQNPAKIISNKYPEYSALTSNTIHQIYESRDGTFWACSEDGINMIYLKPNLFQSYFCSKPDISPNGAVGIRTLLNSTNEFLWVGTIGGGLKQFNLKSQQFTDIPLVSGGKMIGKTIQSIIRDHKGNLWLGTEGDGVIQFILDKKSGYTKGKIINYRIYPKAFPSKTIPNDFIMCLLEDKHHNIWIGTWYGLSLLESSELEKPDQSKAVIKNFLNNPSDNLSISNNIIMSLKEDAAGNIWIGTQEGLNKVVRTSNGYKFDHSFISKDGTSITDKKILAIHQTKKGDLWFSTQDGGISLLNTSTKIFKEFNSNNGFTDNIITSITEDHSGNLWLGSNNGLCRFNPSTPTPSFKNYTTEDGLASNEFLFGSSCSTDNSMYFGSNKSLTAFSPQSLPPTGFKPNLIFTDLRIFNKSINLNDKESPINKHISTVKSITLNHNQNFITIAFADLNYQYQKEIQYSCIMKGLESSWNKLGNEHKITYTNLSPGHYTFEVKAYSSNDYNNVSFISLEIIVNPPLWKTIWAYLLYVTLFVFVLFRIYLYFLNKERRENALAIERLNAKNMHEMDLMRLQFFTNISHEFRTPLTLISAPLESLINDKPDQAKAEKYYQIMLKNVHRLTRLINQLLDLRKIEEGYLKMEWNQGDIVDFVQKTINSFQNYAEKRSIIFSFQANVDQLFTFFDADKLDKVLFNLLSNAFKYTPDNGIVTFIISERTSSEISVKGFTPKYIELKITDSGIGIPKDSIEKIFQPFQQVHENKPIGSAATGIGLSLTKELIEMHNGKITVDSEVNKGSSFTIYLPIYESNPQKLSNIEAKKEIINDSAPTESFEILKTPNNVDTNVTSTKPMVLIVEDNPDLRAFLAGELQKNYRVIEAANGLEGFEHAIQKIPDLIVSDIMMDKMDGIELCQKLKVDERSSHIPIILLTARHSEDTKFNSFEIGADDYITKPFNTNLLLSRIKNLIEQRRKLRSLFSKDSNFDLSTAATNKIDSQFLEKLTQDIEKNIGNPDFDPTMLASNMAMSRMQLYRKVSALTNQTVYNLIRTIRLNKAAELLVSTDMQISEIAENVGYTEPSNFTKCFVRQFNQSPSQFIRSHRK